MRKHISNLFLLLISCCVALLLAEVLVRIFDPHARDSVIPGRLFTIDDDLGWKFHPKKSARHRTRYFDVVYDINSFGFRDRPRETAKDSSTHRILLYGDSLVFGWGVPQGERLSDLLEKGNRTLEVWNHAVPGYGLDQEILLYEKEGGRLNADEVMLFVAWSTLSRIHTTYIFEKYKPMFTLGPDGNLNLITVPKGRNAAISLIYEIFSPFYLPYFLETQLANFRATLRPAGSANDIAMKRAAHRYIGEFETMMLSMAKNIASGRHHEITVLVSNLSQVDRNDLREFCSRNSIGYVEANQDFRPMPSAEEESDRDFIFGRYDTHWNARSNKVIADRVLSQLQERWRTGFQGR